MLIQDFIEKCEKPGGFCGGNNSRLMGTATAANSAFPVDNNNDLSLSAFDILNIDDLETIVSGVPVGSEPQAEPSDATIDGKTSGKKTSPVSSDAGGSCSLPSTTDRLTASLFEGCMEDLKGQITEAVSKDEFYRKWGVFYLRSLAFAHQTQKRNNFKDFGVQWYGEAEFEKQVDRINDIFDKLPPPKPSNKNSTSGGRRYAPTSMAQYNNCYGGCFLPECLVQMADGSQKCCDAMRSGDIIRTGNSIDAGVAKVLCVIKIVGSNMMCVKFCDSQLGITPWHPMLVKGEWVFPAEHAQTLSVGATMRVPTDVVYNFGLESVEAVNESTEFKSTQKKNCCAAQRSRSYTELLRSTDTLKDHTMIINGVPAVTFGHGLDTNAVVRHEYWGNMRAILRDIHVFSGFYDGQVLLQSETACVKDPNTNLVVKLVQRGLQMGISCELTDGDRANNNCVILDQTTSVSTSCSKSGVFSFETNSMAFGCCESIR